MEKRSAISVALIDDHELVREGLRALLESRSQGDISVTYCGQDVSAAAATQAKVTLLDVDLGKQVIGVAERVRVLNAHGSTVILISAFEEGAAIREAVEAGAVGFVPKRVAPEELLEAVRTAARGELILTADLAAILANAANRPALSERERQALSLYASGLTVAEVAAHMGVSPHTSKEYIDRVRDKYTAVGRRARTRTELYAEASKDGMLE